jgi:hypothetical protein
MFPSLFDSQNIPELSGKRRIESGHAGDDFSISAAPTGS